MVYKSKRFALHELVDKEMYKKFKLTKMLDKLWVIIDPKILITIDDIKKFYKKTITINNWGYGGYRQWSCVRRYGKPYYNYLSQHSTYSHLCSAIDFVVKGVDSLQVQKDLLQNQQKFAYLKRIEKDTIGWTHIDCKYTNHNGIYVFNPKFEI